MIFQVELTHSQHSSVLTKVEVPDYDIVSEYENIVAKARKNAASRFVHYESFGNDSAYLDRLDQVSDEFAVVEISMVSDKPKVRYYVCGHYADDEGGVWADWVMASGDEEAHFIARFTMAKNTGMTPGDAHNFQIEMEDCEIFDCYPDPLTKEEAIEFVKQMARFTLPSDPDQPSQGSSDLEGDGIAFHSMIAKARELTKDMT